METNDQIDSQLAEARELGLHKVVKSNMSPKRGVTLVCSCGVKIYRHCIYGGKDLDNFRKMHSNPSPTTNWNDYGELLEWLKSSNRKAPLWKQFKDWLPRQRDFMFIEDVLTNSEQGSRAIAEFLEEKEDVS